VVAQVVGEVERVLLGVEAEGGVRIGREFDVDEELIAAAEFLRVIEGGVEDTLREFELLVQLGLGHQVRVRDVGPDRRDRDPAIADLEAPDAIRGWARVGGFPVGVDRGGVPVLGWQVA